jgi:hypothetical protein
MWILIRFWILLSALLVSTGWILSAFQELNRMGYMVCLAVAAIAAIYWQQISRWRPRKNPRQFFGKFLRRFKRPAPFLFLVLVLLSLVSGILYAPYNSDTCAYRIPRVLHWLGQGQWHWIHTADMRMNVAGCGYEWLATPLILFTHTDRLLFLINWMSYLMLPGLIFSVFKYWGVCSRVAWWWAWVLASGWCYVMQSASVSNDGFATIYALAAVALVLKSQETGNADFWLSWLAMALLTGVKQTDIPLAALWLLAAWPTRRIAFAAPKTFLVMVMTTLLVSGVPVMIFNLLYTGTWDGITALQAEYPDWHIQLDSPFWGIVGNAFYIPVLSLLPPIFPWSGAWNHAMDVFVATPFGAHFKSFERFGAVDPGITETSAGIGLAVILLTAISMCAARKYQTSLRTQCSRLQFALRLCPWILLVIFMAKVGVVQNVRFLAGYYVFFFPSLLSGAGNEILVRKTWWQTIALLCMVPAAILLVVNPNRPLFPAKTILGHFLAAHPQSKALSQLQNAFAAPDSLENLKRQLKENLPPGELLVGFAAVGNSESEPALWLPLGSRRVMRVLKQDTPEKLAEAGIHYVVIEEFPSLDCRNIEDWLARYHAKLVADLPFKKFGGNSRLSHVYITRLELSQ